MAGTYTALYYHIIFSTKNREPRILQNMESRLYEYIGGIIRNEEGVLLEIGGIEDHVHMLLSYPPKKSLSDIMRVVKSKSSRWIKETFEDSSSFAWQEGFGAFTVSQSSIENVRHYIQNQREHHSKKSFQHEFRSYLETHGIEFDENTIWL